jgi:hypothetical protein
VSARIAAKGGTRHRFKRNKNSKRRKLRLMQPSAACAGGCETSSPRGDVEAEGGSRGEDWLKERCSQISYETAALYMRFA